MKLSTADWSEITNSLEIHHPLFYQLWQLGRPVFSDRVPTAAVGFNYEGDCLEFIFNPSFYERLSLEEKKFIVCHECLHVLFNHGLRMRDSKYKDICNIVMDVVVNHTLVNEFGFSRSDLSFENVSCWQDTVFENREVKSNETFEYYYLELIEKCKEEGIPLKADEGGCLLPNGCQPLDDHKNIPVQEAIRKLIEKIGKTISRKEKEQLRKILKRLKNQQAGDSPLGAWFSVDGQIVKKKRKWESVIKRWAKKYLKNTHEDMEQWARIARRFQFLSNDFILPSEVSDDHWSQDRIEVWFFQDTSGSCIDLKDRFFRAARSLPKERFDVRMHTFDTEVYETSLESNTIQGGGGTSFSILEEYIQNHTNNYPKAVFVITDGFGNSLFPQIPENWHWFLSESFDRYVPSGSYIYDLNDFE